MVKEFVTLHIGQAGVQASHAYWELTCMEHGLSADGVLRNEKENYSGEHIDSMYYELRNARHVPRAILMDLEPTVVDEVRTGPYRTLWNPSNIVNHKEDAASNYGRGYYTVGKNFLNTVMDRVNQEVERCDNLSAFEIVHSYAGGTGSGFSSLLIEKISEAFSKKFKFTLGVFPSPRLSEIMVETYNTILHTHCSILNEDCVVLFDNESLFQKCMDKLSVVQPTFSLMNRMIAQMFSSISLSHRYQFFGSQHADITELLTNLVPYPRIHFPIMSYSPIISHEAFHHETYDCNKLTMDVFQPTNQVITCNTLGSKYMSCCMLYRGCLSPKPVIDSIAKIKNCRDVTFVDWCPTGFKIGLNTCPPLQIPHCPQAVGENALCMISGNTSISLSWSLCAKKFDMLLAKRAFVHWYVMEGLEEGEFLDSREDIQSLIMDYEELSNQDLVEGEQDAAETNANNKSRRQMLPKSGLNNSSSVLGNLTNRPMSVQKKQSLPNINKFKSTNQNPRNIKNQLYFTDDIIDIDPELDLSISKNESNNKYADVFEEAYDEVDMPLSKLEEKFGKNRSAVTLSDNSKTLSKISKINNAQLNTIKEKCQKAILDAQKVVGTTTKKKQIRPVNSSQVKNLRFVNSDKDISKTVEKYLLKPNLTVNRKSSNIPLVSKIVGDKNTSIGSIKCDFQALNSNSESISSTERSLYLKKFELMKNNHFNNNCQPASSNSIVKSNKHMTALKAPKAREHFLYKSIEKSAELSVLDVSVREAEEADEEDPPTTNTTKSTLVKLNQSDVSEQLINTSYETSSFDLTNCHLTLTTESDHLPKFSRNQLTRYFNRSKPTRRNPTNSLVKLEMCSIENVVCSEILL